MTCNIPFFLHCLINTWSFCVLYIFRNHGCKSYFCLWTSAVYYMHRRLCPFQSWERGKEDIPMGIKTPPVLGNLQRETNNLTSSWGWVNWRASFFILLICLGITAVQYFINVRALEGDWDWHYWHQFLIKTANDNNIYWVLATYQAL